MWGYAETVYHSSEKKTSVRKVLDTVRLSVKGRVAGARHAEGW